MDMGNNNIRNLYEWYSWFMGFTDAEGCLQVYPKKRYLKSGELSKIDVGYSYHLSLHKRDLDLLKDIMNKLDMGIIYIYKDKAECRLAINRKSDLEKLNKNVFDNLPLLTRNQKLRYEILKSNMANHKSYKTMDEYRLHNEALKSIINYKLDSSNADIWKGLDEGFIDNWITGFINGEGSFDDKNHRFTIEHTDYGVISLIKQRLNANPKIRTRQRVIEGKLRKPTYILAVSSKPDIKSLIELLDSKRTVGLQGNKLLQYKKWKEIKR